MNVQKISYLVTEDDFPLFKNIREIEELFGWEMYKFFDDDYQRDKESEVYSAQCTHRDPVFHEYWIEMLNDSFRNLSFSYESVTWGGESAMEIVSDRLLTDSDKEEIYSKMKELYVYFTKVVELNFDFTYHPMYKYAVDKNAIDIFENWLFNNVVCQAKYALNNDASSCKIKDGEYALKFNKDVDEYYARKFIDEFILSDMKSWIDQDLGIKENK